MLFLAVFCGFLAEYQLEHKIERDREIQYVRSLINDLKTDTAKLNKNIKFYKSQHLSQDTILKTLPLIKDGFNQRFVDNFWAFSGFPDFIYTDATIQQLKKLGGFRLIRNQKVVDSIMSYDAIVKLALINEKALETTAFKSIDFNNKILNVNAITQQPEQGKTFKDLENENFELLLIRDDIVLSQYGNQLLYHRGISKTVAENMKDVKTKADGLLIFLQKEYDIK